MKNSGIYKLFSFVLCCSAFFGCGTTTEVVKDEPIQKMIMDGRYDEAKDLFTTKTDINAKDKNGDTAVHVCARINEPDLITFLVLKGADIEITNNDGDTPLLVAVKNDNVEAAKTLVALKANIFAKDSDGLSVLQIAISKDETWYDVLISEAAGQIRAVNGDTVVHYFVRTGDEKAIDYCIRKELPLSIKNNNGETPVALCYQNVQDETSIRIAAKLIQAGAECERGTFAYFEDAVKIGRAHV